MMFGFEEFFDYIECSKCGCLQIRNIPTDMSKYYQGEKYYSFNEENNKRTVISLVTKKRNEYCLFKNSLIGNLINIKYPNQFFSVLGNLKLDKNSKILDVGCGNGKLLFQLKEIGFHELTGIDPYIKKEILTKNLKILKKTIHSLSDQEKFDLILFSHSFEHMEDPYETLKKVKNILSKKGKCIIRIPVKSEHIWDLYGVNWVQLDAPRHYFIYSPKSLNILSKNSNFKIKEIIYDSTEFQFWGSEQNKRNIPLNSDKSYFKNNSESIFTNKQISQYKQHSKKLNKSNLGDQAIFILNHNEDIYD